MFKSIIAGYVLASASSMGCDIQCVARFDYLSAVLSSEIQYCIPRHNCDADPNLGYVTKLFQEYSARCAVEHARTGRC